MSDYTQRGRALRTFNLGVDEYTRECHCIHADRRNPSDRCPGVVAGGDRAARRPENISAVTTDRSSSPRRSRNGSGRTRSRRSISIRAAVAERLRESFNSRFRAECLNRALLYTLSESQVVFEDWRHYYNRERPHRSLDLQTPEEFAKKAATQGSACGRATPTSGRTLGRKAAAKTNRNQRKLSHLLWAKSHSNQRGDGR